MSSGDRAMLCTADGEVLFGRSVGAEGIATGEAVFNTSMTGYQEIITDPSYAGQVVVMT
ncbi:MAG: carbamoyl-phosphate synthase domain-containing protein, partial [Acidimicrobiia bacterium]